MKQFAVNLSTVFTEVPFLQRFEKAKKAGFSFVECQFPYESTIEEIKKELTNNQLYMVLINLPPGEWSMGERGLAILDNKRDEFRDSVDIGIQYAKGLNVSNLHCMAGIVTEGMRLSEARKVYKENIQYAAAKMFEQNLTLLIEPINNLDMPGYFLSHINEAAEIIQEIAMPNVRLQFDFYHIQRMQGNLLDTFQRYFELIEHVQMADAPGRHQPGTGEINFDRLFYLLGEVGYKGHIGLEYTPKGRSEDSFDWLSGIKREAE